MSQQAKWPADRTRIAERLAVLAEIGATATGGVTRRVYTSEERQAARQVEEWMQEAGLTTYYDAAGNLFGVWFPDGDETPGQAGAGGAASGVSRRRAPVMAGSHVDSVPEGGRFDGSVGVVTALEAVTVLKEAGTRPLRPLAVAVFVGEEGSRYPGLLGSRAVIQGLTDEELAAPDRDGVSLREAMAAGGGDPESLAGARLRCGDVAAFLEVHIEQARVLEDAGASIGVVTGIAGPVFMEGSLTGQADHAGATPMDLRRDSLCGAAEFVLAAERIARETAPATVATVGRIECYPGAQNVIPGETRFTVDLRDADPETRDQAEGRLQESLQEISARRKLEWSLAVNQRRRPTVLPEQMVQLLEGAARAVGAAHLLLASGAAHDAMNMAMIAPVGMLFVRSRDGLSHTPDEFSANEDIAAAADALIYAIDRLGADESLA